MTRDDIIRMAREAGFETAQIDIVCRFAAVLDDFAAVVAAQERKNYEHTLALQQQSYEREIQIEVEAEREACAKVCDARCIADGWEGCYADECAAAIRARGQA
jgi:hypothetical protein